MIWVESEHQSERLVYKLNWPDRWIIAPSFAAVMSAVAASYLRSHFQSDRIIGGCVILASIAAAAWAMAYVCIVLTPDELVIRNLRARRIPYGEITDVTIGYEGIVVSASGRRYLAIAGQKWNLSRILKRRSRADTIADEIRTRSHLPAP
jgi:hypothetical protein